jgi:TRAP-type uncharacterized transport system substrate-binding protein
MKKVFTVWLVMLVMCLFTGISYAGDGSTKDDPIKFGVGGKKGFYAKTAGPAIGSQLRGHGIKNIKYVPGGTPINIKRIISGELDIAIVQFDGIVGDSSGMFDVVGLLHPEFVHFIVKEGSEIGKIEDLTNKHTIAIGKPTSGTSVTWKTFCSLDAKYSKVATSPVSGSRALGKLASGEIDGVLFVSGLRGKTAMRANAKADAYKMVPVTDWDFNNKKVKGNPVYEFDKVDDDVYKGLISGMSCKTIKVRAAVIVNVDWADENEDAFDALFESVTAALPGIMQKAKND